jgi:sugar/nucleoside kinase (ribokinase family)
MARVLCSGSFMCDLIAPDLPRLGEPGDLIYAPKGIDLHPGGHAANVAISLAQLGRKGVAVAGSIGGDVLGDFMEAELRKNGLQVYPERLSIPTSKNIVLVVRGQDRRFYAQLAANTMLTPGHVLNALEETRPEILYQGTIGGLKLVDGELDTILRRAREMGCLTLIDVIRPHEEGWRRLRESLPLTDILHCNGYESEALTGEADPAAAADTILKKGVRLCLVTLGSEGLVAAWGETRLRMPAFGVEEVDQTGAGDAFCAGVIDALLQMGLDRNKLVAVAMSEMKPILLRGSAAGAACVTAPGATTAVTPGKVDALIKEQGEIVWAETLPI